MSNCLWPHGVQPTRLLYPWDFPGKNTGMGCHFLISSSWGGSFHSKDWTPSPASPALASGFFYYLSHVLTCKKISTVELWTLNLESLAIWECRQGNSLLLLLSCFSCVQLCATPWTEAYQASPSMEFSRQEHWSGVPFPSPMHESGKWQWSHSVVSDSSQPHGLQPTRLLHPWDFLGNSTGVWCHCLIHC